jgi:hypothetical protein
LKDLKTKFLAHLPRFFNEVLTELRSQGYTPTLVGGTVRDFHLNGHIGKDWDIELSHATIAFSKDQWKLLGKSLAKFGKTSYLSYEIIRLEIESYQLEFSPPRTETYLPEMGNHHSNFTAEFDFKMPFEKAVLRRDFTINAMGIRFESLDDFDFLDPMDGLKHLQERVLHSVGKDFAKDPVRFLRAHRFSEKLHFSFSKELQKILDEMSADGFTHSYLWSEMQKSGNPLHYLERLVQAVATHPELKLPLGEIFLSKTSDLKKVLVNQTCHESWIIALEWVEIPSEEWTKYFGLSSESCRRLARWAEASKFFLTSLPEAFQGEFDEFKNTPSFEKLFDWYFTTKQLLQKNPDLPLMKMIEEYLPNWIYLYRFEAPKDVKHIDPPFRAKYQVWNLCQRL